MKPLAKCTLALAVLCAIVTAWAIFANYGYDDAFITYRYSRHFAEGHGFVYNVGARYFGTTAPLWGLVLGCLGWALGPNNIPYISAVLYGACLLALGAGLLSIGERYGQARTAFVAALAFILIPSTQWFWGTEFIPQIAAAVWAINFADQKKLYPAFLMAAVVVLLRPDGLALLPALFAFVLWKHRKVPVLPALACLSMLGVAAAISYNYYGVILPASVGAKVTMSSVTGSYLARELDQLAVWFFNTTPQISHTNGSFEMLGGWVFPLLAIVGLLSWRRLLPFLPIFLWIAFKEAGYIIIGASFFPWYSLPLLFGFAILIGCGVANIYTTTRRPQYAFAACAFLVVASVSWNLGKSLRPYVRKERYIAIGKWLNANTAPDTMIACQEIGWVGWHSDRPLLDMVGLVSRGVQASRMRGEPLWMFKNYEPDVVFGDHHFGANFTKRFTEDPWFRSEYRPWLDYEYEPWEPITLYRRASSQSKKGIKLSEPLPPPTVKTAISVYSPYGADPDTSTSRN